MVETDSFDYVGDGPNLNDLRANLKRAVVRLCLVNQQGDWEGATAFMVSPTLALTAYHFVDELRKQGQEQVTALHTDDLKSPLTFEVIPEAALEGPDIAALKLVHKPETVDLGYLRPACWRPCEPSRVAQKHWSGRRVLIWGFTFSNQGHVDREILGNLHSGQPVQEVCLGPQGGGKTLRVEVVADHTQDLPGISGAPICDLESGSVVAVQHSCDPNASLYGTGAVYGAPLCLLAQAWPRLAEACPDRAKPKPWIITDLLLAAVLLALAVALVLICPKFCCSPTIREISEVSGELKGSAGCADSAVHHIAVYIRVDDRWYVKPYAEPGTVRIGPRGDWSADITTGGHDEDATVAHVFLLPLAYMPPSVLGTLTLPQELFEHAEAEAEVALAPAR